MNKEKMLQIAERNMNKANRALLNNIDRNGITEEETENLFAGVEYARIVYDLIAEHYRGGEYEGNQYFERISPNRGGCS